MDLYGGHATEYKVNYKWIKKLLINQEKHTIIDLLKLSVQEVSVTVSAVSTQDKERTSAFFSVLSNMTSCSFVLFFLISCMRESVEYSSGII